MIPQLLDFVARSLWMGSDTRRSKGELTFVLLAVAAGIFVVVILYAIAT